jgi:hypothetical protein
MCVLVLATVRSRWLWFCVGSLLFVVLGQSLIFSWQPHYPAPVVPLVLAAMTMTLHQVNRRCGTAWMRTTTPAMIVGLAAMYVIVPPTIKVFTREVVTAGAIQGPARAHSRPTPISRSEVLQRLESEPGSHLVFVTYDEDFSVHDGEWVFNLADLTTAPVVFAHDLGRGKNAELIHAFSSRRVWAVRVSKARTELEPYPDQ